MENGLEQQVLAKAQKWLDGNYDAETKKQVKYLMDNDMKELVESFYKDLEFGTGGLRGVMGVGTNRMNIYTVGAATPGRRRARQPQQFADVRRACGRHLRLERIHRISVRRAASDTRVELRDPGAEMSVGRGRHGFAQPQRIQRLQSLLVRWIAGYDEVEKITEVDQVLTGRNPQNIHALGKDFDELYLNKIYELSLSSESVKRFHDMKIVYSPMHGAGVRLVPESLKRFGFTNVQMVPEQAVIDGNFPTVESPNPEERKTMSMAIDLAKKVKADLVLATDPDSDRIGVALPDENGEYVLLNGNQTLVLLMTYQLTRWAELGRLNGHQYVIKTIVTTEMVDAVADYFKVKCYECLTGFKYIAKIIRGHEGTDMQYIGGGEESFGYLAGDYVRDKDGVSACSLAAEAAAWVRDTMGISLYEWLKQLYVKYGFYQEGLVSVVRTGKEGAELIQRMMVDYRANPPKEILGSLVVKINDIQTLESFDFGVKATLPSVADYEKVRAELNDKIERIKKELKLV